MLESALRVPPLATPFGALLGAATKAPVRAARLALPLTTREVVAPVSELRASLSSPISITLVSTALHQARCLSRRVPRGWRRHVRRQKAAGHPVSPQPSRRWMPKRATRRAVARMMRRAVKVQIEMDVMGAFGFKNRPLAVMPCDTPTVPWDEQQGYCHSDDGHVSCANCQVPLREHAARWARGGVVPQRRPKRD